MHSRRVCEFMSRKIREPKNLASNLISIVVYPQNSIDELAEIMMNARIECLPVFFSPWNKKTVGFIEFKKISPFIND